MKTKAFAKINIFLKITGLRGNYHELFSRFVRVKELFDLVSFEKKKSSDFEIEGNFSCKIEKNSIYKAYLFLKEIDNKTEKFFKEHKIKVDKNIPEFAGLGGGSSDAASFLLLANDVLQLKLSKEKLCFIGEKIGADVPFFIYGYESANVSGIGEVVEPFFENTPSFEIFTPPIKCDTPLVYKKFRENLKGDLSILKKNRDLADELKNMNSRDILKEYNPKILNDLFPPALDLCKDLLNYQNKMFFSGSGSSFFKVKDE